jgi:hypothetical protein
VRSAVCDFLQLNVTSFHLWSVIFLNILFLSSSVFLKKMITDCVQFSVRYVQLKLSCSIALAVRMLVHVGIGKVLTDICTEQCFWLGE